MNRGDKMSGNGELILWLIVEIAIVFIIVSIIVLFFRRLKNIDHNTREVKKCTENIEKEFIDFATKKTKNNSDNSREKNSNFSNKKY